MNLENLKELRLQKGLSQVEVAKHCGVSVNAYIHWEKGVSKPTEENEAKLEKIFN